MTVDRCGAKRTSSGPRLWPLVGALAAWTVASAHAAGLAPDQAGVSIGREHDIDVYGVGLTWGLPVGADFLERHDLSVRLAADVSYWRGRDRGAPVTTVWDFGATPLLRWSPPGNGSVRGFAEVGIGLHVLSHSQINSRRFSTAFQFGERAALGVAIGPGERFEIGGYVEHVSNADIKLPNDGVTQGGVMVRVRLE